MTNTPRFLLHRSASPMAVLIVVGAILTTACSAGQGAASSSPGSTSRASTTPAPSIALTPTPTPTAAPTPTPSPSPTPAVLPEGDSVALVPGRYAFPIRATNPKISFTVPSGWAGNSVLVGKDDVGSGTCSPVGCKGTNPGSDTAAAPFVFNQAFDHGFKDPCTNHTPVVPAAGSGAAGLLAVIAAQPGIHAGPITGVTVGGHTGKYVDYTVTVDPAACGNGEDGFWIWGTCPAPVTPGCENVTGDRRYGVSKNGHERSYAIDVDGKTVTFLTNQPVDLTAADRAELQRVLDSIEFEPAA